MRAARIFGRQAGDERRTRIRVKESRHATEFELKQRAQRHARSMEDEVRHILCAWRLGVGLDTMIAGIALARRATIATRNTTHFEGLDVPVVNPWDAARND